MKSSKFLGVGFACLLLASCKPQDHAGPSTVSTFSQLPKVHSTTGGAFNLAAWIAENKVGGPNMENNQIGSQYLYFSSQEGKSQPWPIQPEFELRMNATLSSDAKKGEMKSHLWIDGSLNGSNGVAGSKAIEGEVLASGGENIMMRGDLNFFGQSVVSQSMDANKPFRITKTVELGRKESVLGIPKISGVEGEGSLVASVTLLGEAHYLTAQSASLAMMSSVKVTAGVKQPLKPLAFAEVKALGTMTVVDTQLLSSATMHVPQKRTQDLPYGNVTFKSRSFNALLGDIKIRANRGDLEGTEGGLPAGVEPSLWKASSDKEWPWNYTVWDAPSLISIKFPAAYSQTYLASQSLDTACAPPSIAQLFSELDKPNVAGNSELRDISREAAAGLKAIQSRAKGNQGSCREFSSESL